MTTCTAPTCPTATGPTDHGTTQDRPLSHWGDTSDGVVAELVADFGPMAPLPPTCWGTDWPPLTSWERYAAERRGGVRVPPSVSVWREQDVRRQAAAEREARSQAPEQPAEPRVVAWGPSCEDERPAHRIGVRS